MPCQRFAIRFEYDGTDFVGWQYQTNGRSVQAVVDSAIKLAFGRAARNESGPVKAVGAARTDAGVHARGQVAHIDLQGEWTGAKVVAALDEHLPADCRARAAAPVPPEFHARRDALMKRYTYHLSDGERPVIERRTLAWTETPLDVERMAAAAQAWLGKHDFSAFRDAHCEAASSVRTLSAITIERHEHIVFTFAARSFLHHQVRIMIGTLVEIGRGAKPVEWAAELLAATDRSAAGPTMPACGLSLDHIAYRRDVFV